MGGTPDELVEQTVSRVRELDAAGVVNVLSFGRMPPEVARRNLDTYTEHVLPKLAATDPHRDIRAARPPGTAARPAHGFCTSHTG